AAELDAAARLFYRQLDVVDAAQVHALLTELAVGHAPIKGIIHSAGMIADNLLLRKTPAEFADVLAPKVQGAVNLDHASRHIDLDFLALFSSAAAVMGNPGQSDYAVA